MNNKINQIEEYFRKNGLKLTNQRKAVVGKMLAIRSHLTVDQITDMLKNNGYVISRATVYRILSIMKKGKFIDEHDFNQKKKYYESALGKVHHDHIFCMGCGKIVEFHNDNIEKLQDEIIKKCKFVAIYHSHKIFGYCQNCQKNTI